MPSVFSKALYFVILGGALAAPCVLAMRSFPKVRDTGLLSDLATELTRPLPNQPSILVSDNMAYLWLAEAQRRRTPNAPDHLLIHTGDARREEVLRQAALPSATQVIVAADRDDTSVLVSESGISLPLHIHRLRGHGHRRQVRDLKKL